MDTIGKEEEIEAWKEMADFFGEQFELIILEMQQKYKDEKEFKDIEEDPQKQRQELLEAYNLQIANLKKKLQDDKDKEENEKSLE